MLVAATAEPNKCVGLEVTTLTAHGSGLTRQLSSRPYPLATRAATAASHDSLPHAQGSLHDTTRLDSDSTQDDQRRCPPVRRHRMPTSERGPRCKSSDQGLGRLTLAQHLPVNPSPTHTTPYPPPLLRRPT
ncbi:hypothetical protein J1614_008129 [Plenodomus biglobosus]|nr:hypothetical protein J1614_008129 [Plenodomus biglobosus]